MPPPRTFNPRRLFAEGSAAERARIADILREETVGGALLVLAAMVALVWANTAWSSSYADLRDLTVGPSDLLGFHLDLSLGTWAADG
nr:Na+/H+ antiporter NhaA [Solirubrobacterales bacterium]